MPRAGSPVLSIPTGTRRPTTTTFAGAWPLSTTGPGSDVLWRGGPSAHLTLAGNKLALEAWAKAPGNGNHYGWDKDWKEGKSGQGDNPATGGKSGNGNSAGGKPSKDPVRELSLNLRYVMNPLARSPEALTVTDGLDQTTTMRCRSCSHAFEAPLLSGLVYGERLIYTARGTGFVYADLIGDPVVAEVTGILHQIGIGDQDASIFTSTPRPASFSSGTWWRPWETLALGIVEGVFWAGFPGMTGPRSLGGELGGPVQTGPATGERTPIGWTGAIGEEDLVGLGGEAHNYGGVAVVSERESEMTGGRSHFLGCVILESLADAGPLQGLTPVHVRREEHPGDPDATVWHVQWYYLPEAAVRELAAALAPVMKPNWYAHFFNRRVLIVILPRRVFQAGATEKTTWEPFIAYGETVGVGQHWTRRVPVEAPAYLEELGREFDLD